MGKIYTCVHVYAERLGSTFISTCECALDVSTLVPTKKGLMKGGGWGVDFRDTNRVHT